MRHFVRKESDVYKKHLERREERKKKIAEAKARGESEGVHKPVRTDSFIGGLIDNSRPSGGQVPWSLEAEQETEQETSDEA